MSLSEVSDATEIKSLSENPRNHSNSNRSNDNSRNVSLRTNSSRTWKDRLLNVADDDTKYRSLERAENFSLSQVPTPLTDEVPERDLSDAKVSKSEKLRKIVSEVFDRHKSDLELIRNTVEDVDVPDTVISGPVEDFVPRYPSILSRHDPDFADYVYKIGPGDFLPNFVVFTDHINDGTSSIPTEKYYWQPSDQKYWDVYFETYEFDADYNQ